MFNTAPPPPPLQFMEEVLTRERQLIKWVEIFQVGRFWVEIFRNFQGGNFPGGNSPRTG